MKCTGYRTRGSLQHDGPTCPIHEVPYPHDMILDETNSTRMEPLSMLVHEMGFRAACVVLDLALEAKTLPLRVARHVAFMWRVCK